MKPFKVVTSLCLTVGALFPASCATDTTDTPGGSTPSYAGTSPQLIPTGASGSSAAPQAGSASVPVQPSAGTASVGSGGTNSSGGTTSTSIGGSAAAGHTSTGGTASSSGGTSTGGSAASGAPDPTCSTGIAGGTICCAASCGTCGGMGCADKPGGSQACCKNPIIASGVSCAQAGPPCILDGASSGGSGSGGSSATGGSGNSGGSSSTGDACAAPGLTWKSANKTNFESYPDPGSEECIKYNGCTWAGEFAFCDGKKPESWVKQHDIVAVFPQTGLENHDICIKQGNKTMRVTVLDTCGDSDCDGCCTENRGSADRLIDLEKYTNERWGLDDGKIQWADIGPNPSSCN